MSQDFVKMLCTTMPGVGVRTAALLQKCGIVTVQDLLLHLPLHYQDRTHVTPIASLRVGDHVVIEGHVEYVEIIKGRRISMLVHMQDGTGHVQIRFFHLFKGQPEHFALGVRLRCFGEVRFARHGKEIVHPEYRILHTEAPVSVDETLTPIYPSTAGLSQKVLRDLTTVALRLLTRSAGLVEYIPLHYLQALNFLSITEALLFVHRPTPEAQIGLLESGIHPAQQRLAFEELLARRLSLQLLRGQTKQEIAPLISISALSTQCFLQALPFTLTTAQQRVVDEIYADLTQSSPMLRLVQGDVGSGKTVVAALAMLQVITSGYQIAFMVPTELLADQHYANLQQWFSGLNITVISLLGRDKGKQRARLLKQIVVGEASIIVGTHALFQEQVQFHKLGLIIIDEQHRFGVHQRLALRAKGDDGSLVPHQLIMTATPIPRTLAMTAYADLDISIINELPPGRQPVTTVVVSSSKRADVINRIRASCGAQKQQAYWVCTLIDDSEVLNAEAAEVTYVLLTQQLPELRIGLVHGRTKSQAKKEIMQAFKDGAVDLLVATTVIEVGVDVPNASLMIIENAERLGLAQLHQLRGRVGRGAAHSFCVLFYQFPLGDLAKERLHIMRNCNDGFVIAEKDLVLRGPGEVLGTRQTGLAQLKIANLVRDQHLLPHVQKVAEALVRENNIVIIQALMERWGQDCMQYGVV